MGGQLKHAGKPPALRGLNVNHNHDLKNVFKSAATRAGASKDPFVIFYQNLLAKGIEPQMARLTLARKIAAIVLNVWKKGEHFDPAQLNQHAA
jgi:transposase